MPRVCAVKSCNCSGDVSTLFRFPKDDETCLAWIQVCQRDDVKAVLTEHGAARVNNSYYVCAAHFADTDFMNSKDKTRGLIRGRVPHCWVPAISGTRSASRVPVHEVYSSVPGPTDSLCLGPVHKLSSAPLCHAPLHKVPSSGIPRNDQHDDVDYAPSCNKISSSTTPPGKRRRHNEKCLLADEISYIDDISNIDSYEEVVESSHVQLFTTVTSHSASENVVENVSNEPSTTALSVNYTRDRPLQFKCKPLLGEQCLETVNNKLHVIEKRFEHQHQKKVTSVVGDCLAVDCKSFAGSEDAIFFPFPVDEPRRCEWLHNCGRDDLISNPLPNMKLCDRHFETCQFVHCNRKGRLVASAQPTIFASSGDDYKDFLADNKQVLDDVKTEVAYVFDEVGSVSAAEHRGLVYKNFEELRKDAHYLVTTSGTWYIVDEPTRVTVGLLDGFQTFVVVMISADDSFTTRVAVYGIPQVKMHSLRNCRLSEFIEEISSMCVCCGIEDPNLQQFAEFPVNDASKKFFRHVTYSVLNGEIIHNSCILSVRCERLIPAMDSSLPLMCVPCHELYGVLAVMP